MGTLWNVDNTGNLTVGSIAGRSQTTIKQNVLPLTRTNASTITAALNNDYIINNGSGWVLNIPSGAQTGDRIRVTTEFVAGTIQLPSFNYVNACNKSSTLGGTLSCSDETGTIDLECSFNTGQVQWDVLNVTGNWLVSGSPSNFYINGSWGGFPVLSVTGELDVGGELKANLNAASNSINTGSLIAAGGIGANGNINGTGLGLFLQTNGSIGTSTMSSGSALVPNTSISATSFPVAISMSAGVVGALRIVSKTVGVGFTIQSSVPTDSGQVFWFIMNQV